MLHPTNHYPPCPADARGSHPSTRDSMQQAAAKHALFDGPASHCMRPPYAGLLGYSKCVNRLTILRVIGDMCRLVTQDNEVDFGGCVTHV